MRRHDVVETVAGLGPSDHVCEDRDVLLRTGQLTLLDVAKAYDLVHDLMPERQHAAYVAQTEQAVRDGYRGLRVVAEVTALVDSSHRRSAFARYEHLVDRSMARGLRSPRCAPTTIACSAPMRARSAACTRCPRPPRRPHPSACSETATRSRWAARSTASARRCSSGCSVTSMRQHPLEIDLSDLRFIDHHGLMVLARRHESPHAMLVLTGASPVVRHLWTLLFPLAGREIQWT